MANRIREFLDRAERTQAWLAEQLACTPMSVSYYANGRRTPDLETSRSIVRALNEAGVACDLDDVFPPGSEGKAA